MEELFANANLCLTPRELEQAITGEIDLLMMRDEITRRAEVDARGGQYLPAYSAAAT